MDVIILVSNFRYYLRLKTHFRHNSAGKNLFLSACYIWNDIFSLREMDQKFPFRGLIGYGNSYLDSILCYSKVFWLHAILHDADGAVRSHTGNGLGYCYIVGQGPNSCLLDQVTWLLFCLYVKIFVPFVINSVNFWISMSLIVLDIVLTVRNIMRELGLFIDWSLQGFHFVCQILLNLINRRHGTQVIYMELRGVVESWIMISSLLPFTT